jgi:hypothetical protein
MRCSDHTNACIAAVSLSMFIAVKKLIISCSSIATLYDVISELVFSCQARQATVLFSVNYWQLRQLGVTVVVPGSRSSR